MANPSWRSRLIAALRRQGLPGHYIERMVEELCDHAADLSQENPSMDAQTDLDARLGTPEQLAAAAKSEFQNRTFVGRHPIMTFIVGPPVILFVAFVASVLLVIGASEVLDFSLGGMFSANDAQNLPPLPLEIRLMHTFNGIVRFLPFIFAAWLFARLGLRCGRRIWSIAACSIVALVALLFTSVVTPGTPQSLGMWMMGFGWNFGVDQILQAVVPAALSAWLLWRSPASGAALNDLQDCRTS